MNNYSELKLKHQKEVNEFPFMFAFSNQQFEEGMRKLGLDVNDTDKIYSIGAGRYIRRTDSEAMNEMFNRHSEELENAIENDRTGDDFIYEMFCYELNNHEYSYTMELDDTLDALGYSIEDIYSNDALYNGLSKAMKTCRYEN